MKNRKQFNQAKYEAVDHLNKEGNPYLKVVVSSITETYPKTCKLHKVAIKLLKTQQELNALLAEEGGVIGVESE